MYIVETKNLAKDFYIDGKVQHVIQDITLSIKQGTLTMIVGPSGCGKTTLISLITSILTPTRGDILVKGTSINDLSSREKTDFRLKNIGFVFQYFNLLPMLTCLENTMLPLEISGCDPTQADKKARHILEDLGMKNHLDKLPAELSGGQKQRVAIARSLVNDPELIVCDEPTSALNSEVGEQIMELFKYKINQDKRSIVIVTHDQLNIIIPCFIIVFFVIMMFMNFSKPARPVVKPLISPPTSHFDKSVSGLGAVEPKSENIKLCSNASGVLKKIYVKSGQIVDKDEPIFMIDNCLIKASMEIIRQNLLLAFLEEKEAEESYARHRRCYERVQDSITKETLSLKKFGFEKAQQKVASIQAQFEELNTQLNQMTVVAPFKGRVLKVIMHEGEYANHNPVVVFGDVITCIRAEFDETDLHRIKQDGKAFAIVRGRGLEKIPLRLVKKEPLLSTKRIYGPESKSLFFK